jgi:hypothetical protein
MCGSLRHLYIPLNPIISVRCKIAGESGSWPSARALIQFIWFKLTCSVFEVHGDARQTEVPMLVFIEVRDRICAHFVNVESIQRVSSCLTRNRQIAHRSKNL